MNKTATDWKITAFVVAVGGLKLLGLLFGALRPHLNDVALGGLGANVAAAVALAPFPDVRRCGDWGGRAGDSTGQHGPRIRLSSDRRYGESSSAVVQVTSSSR